MIKRLALSILLTPVVLMATSKPAITLQEIRRNLGVPSRPGPEIVSPEAKLAMQAAAPFTATPVPLSIQAPQIASAISSSLTSMQETTGENKEKEAKDDDEKLEHKAPKEAQYTSDEDATILFEIVNGLDSLPLACKKVVQDRKQTKFFEAIDAHDIQTILALASENINLLFKSDLRGQYRHYLQTDTAQNLLRFYHEQLLTAAEWHEMRHLGRKLAEPLFEKVFIDATSLAFRLTKDLACNRYLSKAETPDNLPLDKLQESIRKDPFLKILLNLFPNTDTLSREIMSGHDEIADTLLNALIIRLDRMILETQPKHRLITQSPAMQVNSRFLQWTLSTLDALLDCSMIANSSGKCQKAAAVLFRHIGLKNKPHYENYPKIARKLIRALIHIATIAEQYWWQQVCKQMATVQAGQPPLYIGNKSPLVVTSEKILDSAIRRGTSEMLQIIGEEMAAIKRDPRNGIHQAADSGLAEKFKKMAIETVNGEKLGILLSIDSHPESMPYILAMGMLSHVEKNPRLLARLKKYVRRYQMTDALINAQVNEYLLPVLAPCVSDYVHYMPAETQEYILNLRPVIPAAQPTDEQENYNEGILGEHITALMQQQPRDDGEQHD